ncbi:MAG: Sec-independent protein translocase subunit TatA [Streptosporangiales bacterium]|jgi:sec-independent protein translocase protein TatA|nr:Sec-independent protein translocase subunit TatA [Streptosporangiales bacterium]
MIGDLFDSPWKILIIAVVIIVLFGSRKLPQAARSLGQSMRILKKEVSGLHEDEADETKAAPAAQLEQAAPAAEQGSQAKIEELQKQLDDLKSNGDAPAETQQTR